MGSNRIPYIVTHDARTLRYPAPDINVLDTVKINLSTGKVTEVIKFETRICFCFSQLILI